MIVCVEHEAQAAQPVHQAPYVSFSPLLVLNFHYSSVDFIFSFILIIRFCCTNDNNKVYCVFNSVLNMQSITTEILILLIFMICTAW